MPGDQKLLPADEGRSRRLTSTGAGFAKLRAHRQEIPEQLGGRDPVQGRLPRGAIEANGNAPRYPGRDQGNEQRGGSLPDTGARLAGFDRPKQGMLDQRWRSIRLQRDCGPR